jgi:RNA polymerase sigma-70 factor (ECF subfamily)
MIAPTLTTAAPRVPKQRDRRSARPGTPPAAPRLDFDDLVRHRRAQLVQAAYRRLDNWADAEEAVQDALLRAWIERNDYRPELSPAYPWVSTIVQWEALHVDRARSRYVPVGAWDRDIEDCPAAGTDLPCMAEKETRRRVFAALKTLSPREQQVVKLHCLDQVPTAEVATRLGVSREYVERTLRSALCRLGETPCNRVQPPQEKNRLLGVDSPLAQTVRARPELLTHLSERARQVMRLRYIERLSLADISKQCGITVPGVSVQVRRGRRMVAAILSAEAGAR